jgi:hypothetical protein
MLMSGWIGLGLGDLESLGNCCTTTNRTVTDSARCEAVWGGRNLAHHAQGRR